MVQSLFRNRGRQREVKPSADILKAERDWFRCLLTYFVQNPGFFTTLNETETVSKQALETHVENLVRAYTRTLKGYARRGEIKGWSDSQLEIISIMLISARAYLYQYYVRGRKRGRAVPDEVVDTYIAFLRNGIRGSQSE